MFRIWIRWTRSFWGSGIRICYYLCESGYCHQQAKKQKKTTLIYVVLWLLNYLWSLKTRSKLLVKNIQKKTFFVSWKPLKKRAGSGSGSESSVTGSFFLGPNGTRFARCHFRAQKSLDFQSPPLPMPLVMMLHASKPGTASYKQQGH